jgi:hypothetical protein
MTGDVDALWDGHAWALTFLRDGGRCGSAEFDKIAGDQVLAILERFGWRIHRR